MNLKYDQSPQSFFEDDFDFLLSRSKKPMQKTVPLQTKHKKEEYADILPLETQSTEEKFSKTEPITIEPLAAEPSKIEPLEVESFKVEEVLTDHESWEDRRNRYIILAIRVVIMPLIAFALTFWLYSLIDNVISHYQYQRFSTTTTVSVPDN